MLLEQFTSLSGVGSIISYLILFYIAYFFIYRLVVQYYKRWYYERQGIPFCKGIVPLFGTLPRMKKILDEFPDFNGHPGTIIFE